MSGVPRSRWVMRGLLLFALAFSNLHDIWSPDVLPNALLPFTLLREGDVDYDEFVFRTAPSSDTLQRVAGAPERIDAEAYFFRACGQSTATEPPKAPRSKGGPPAPGPNDHVCSVFPPGMGFLAIPFFLPAVVTGAEPLDLGMLLRVGHVAAAAIEVLAALLLWAVLRRLVSQRAALALVLLYFLGTSVRTVSSQALWQHAGVHLALMCALWLVLVERPLSARRSALAGLALGLGGVVRQTTAAVALGATGVRPRSALLALAGAAAGLVPLLAFNWIAYGSPVEQGYGSKPFDTPVLAGLVGLLFSPSRGLFIYEPWALLALGGLAVARLSRGHIAGRLGTLLLVWVLLVFVYATYAEWWGGRVFGPRFLDDLAPVLILGLAWAVREGGFRAPLTRGLLWLSAAWSLLIFNAAALVYDQSWDTVPVNVNDDPARLFSWTDPQWLAVLREVPDGGVRVAVSIAVTLLVLLFLARVEGLIGRRVVASGG
ncbi:MAG TPA: hypothetical protein VFM06_08460 [Candidatus Limnocylindria bacterium]|nr:hypothetical protein [Candidatus Limnocylindria bacterium]